MGTMETHCDEDVVKEIFSVRIPHVENRLEGLGLGLSSVFHPEVSCWSGIQRGGHFYDGMAAHSVRKWEWYDW